MSLLLKYGLIQEYLSALYKNMYLVHEYAPCTRISALYDLYKNIDCTGICTLYTNMHFFVKENVIFTIICNFYKKM